jgi:5-(carboxyamino)imidazole ribonucleotide mutase
VPNKILRAFAARSCVLLQFSGGLAKNSRCFVSARIGAAQLLAKPIPPPLAPGAPFVYAAAFAKSSLLDKILAATAKPVALIMGSQSDWKTMRHAAATLDALEIGYEALIVSAHRTPDRLVSFAKGAAAKGFKLIIAGAGGAAHLPGMTAALTLLPVFGVPVETKALSGQDSLLSIVQMPAGIPVGTLAIGEAGAVNAALLAAAVLALTDNALAARLAAWRLAQTQSVAEQPAEG